MHPLKKEFVDLSDKFFGRFTARIDGLTDDEYLWQPAPDCWSLERRPDGNLHMRWGLVFDEVPPVTTIAWRYTHIIDLLSEERCATYIGLEPETENLFADGAPPDAATARSMLDEAFARWKRYITAADEQTFFDPIGPVAPRGADQTRTRFILHILDEAIHHGAEVGVLRDLYQAERTSDDAVSALLRGDDVDAATVDDVRARRPDLMLFAAATARWDAIPRLLELGFGIEGRDGRTPLHHAAADGRLDLIRLLIDAGADVTTRDAVYKATPREWAAFFNRSEAVELLTSRESAETTSA